jgi:carbon-monoxide dehydrogenase large subunit
MNAPWTGRALRRVEDAALVRGLGRFAGDVAPDALLHIAFLRADRAGLMLTGMAADDVRAMPGVVAVFGPDDVAGLGHAAINPVVPLTAPPRFPILSPLAAAVGQPLAAVVADTHSAARDGVEALFPDFADADIPLDRVVDHRWQAGALPDDAQRVAVTVRHARVAAMPMEPRCATAEWRDGRLTVWLSTQTPSRAQADLAAILHLEPAVIRVIAGDVGGAFGAKASLAPEDAVTAFAAYTLGRAVRWKGSREEDLLSGTHGRGGTLTGEALVRQGRIAALRAELDFPLGHWMPFSGAVPGRNAARILPGPYAVANVDIHLVETMEARAATGIYRGAGRPEAVMLMERLMDETAQTLAVDPLALRRAHVLPAGTPDAPTPTGELLDNADYAALLDAAAQAAGYHGLRAEQTRRRAAGAVFGIGIALYTEPCGAGWESAALAVRDGCFVLASGATAQGQGRLTALAQLAADALGVRFDAITVHCGDTDTSPAGTGALASRSTAIGGSAALAAVDHLIARALPLAAGLLQAPVEALVYRDGAFHHGGASVDWSALPPLSVDLRYTAPGEAWASGCCIAALSVTRETGELAVERLVWVDDAGTLVNPLLVKGQLVGGAAQGLGEALMERIVYDADGQLLTGSLMDYALPRAMDMPEIEILSLPTPSARNRLGAKGVGEAGCIGVPAAVVNAAVDALRPFGVNHLDMPLTAEKLWRAMNGVPQRKD